MENRELKMENFVKRMLRFWVNGHLLRGDIEGEGKTTK